MIGDVTVREIMTREYVGISESDSVGAAADLLVAENGEAAVVLRGSDPVGMLTVTDALAHLARDGTGDEPVADVMSGTTPTVPPDHGYLDAANTLAEAATESLLVVDDGELVGLVTRRDVVGATASVGGPETVTAEAAPATAVAAESDPDHAVSNYSSQSVCEICGSLTPELQNFNGQLICGDCREL
jgi:CBS-domain-containing membrane protein